MGDGMDAMEYGRADESAERKPQLFLKYNKDVVGAAWVRQGQFGKYISLTVNKDLPAGSKVYLNPRKGFENVLA